MNMPENNSLPNINRFNGFDELYDRNRPQPPLLVTDVLVNYLQKRPQLVLDVGCGTGLSTMIWADKAANIIGVDANADMLGRAQSKLEQQPVAGMSFRQGYSNELPASSASVDIVTCSQCFHWMEPVSTLQEVERVLTDGGIFVAYDCDWPPVLNWQLEREHRHLSALSERLLEQYGDPEQAAIRRDKSTHLQTLEQSGHFRFVREIVFHHTEPCSAERYLGLMLSFGSMQAVLKLDKAAGDLESELAVLKAMADQFFRGGMINVLFSYRMRLGIK